MTLSLKRPIEAFCNAISREPALNVFEPTFSPLKCEVSYQDVTLPNKVEEELTRFMINMEQLRKTGFWAFFGWDDHNEVADKGEEALKIFAKTLETNLLLSPLEPVYPHAYLWAAGCFVGMNAIWQNKHLIACVQVIEESKREKRKNGQSIEESWAEYVGKVGRNYESLISYVGIQSSQIAGQILSCQMKLTRIDLINRIFYRAILNQLQLLQQEQAGLAHLAGFAKHLKNKTEEKLVSNKRVYDEKFSAFKSSLNCLKKEALKADVSATQAFFNELTHALVWFNAEKEKPWTALGQLEITQYQQALQTYLQLAKDLHEYHDHFGENPTHASVREFFLTLKEDIKEDYEQKLSKLILLSQQLMQRKEINYKISSTVKCVVDNILLLLKGEPIDTDMLACYFDYLGKLGADPIFEKIIETARKRIFATIETQLQSFGKEEEKLLDYVALLPLEHIKAFDLQTDQYIQNKISQINAFRVLKDNWDKVLDDAQLMRLSQKSLDRLIGYVLSVDAEPSVMRHIVATGFVGKNSDFEKKVFNDLHTLLQAGDEVNVAPVIDRLKLRLQWINSNQIGYKHYIYSNTLHLLRERILDKIATYIHTAANLNSILAIEKKLSQVFISFDQDEALQGLIHYKRKTLLEPSRGIFKQFQEKTTAELEYQAAELYYRNVISFLLDKDFADEGRNFLENIVIKIKCLSSISFSSSEFSLLPDEKEKLVMAQQRSQDDLEAYDYYFLNSMLVKSIARLINAEKKLFQESCDSREIARKKEIACDLKKLISRVWQLMLAAMHEEERVRFDKRMRQEADIINYKNLVLLYLNLMQVLSTFKQDAVFGDLWQSFIWEFNETMLSDKKAPYLFTHMSARSLEQIFQTWQEDPALIEPSEKKLEEISVANTPKLLPKYLLTRMVGDIWVSQLESLAQGACELIVLESFGIQKRLSHLKGYTRFAYVLANEGLFFIDRDECKANQIQLLTVDVNKIKEIKAFFKINHVSDDGFINIEQGPVQHVSKVVFSLMPNQLSVFQKKLGHDNQFITKAYEELFNGVRYKLDFLLPKWVQASKHENIFQDATVVERIRMILAEKMTDYQRLLKVDEQMEQFLGGLQYEILRAMLTGVKENVAAVDTLPTVEAYAQKSRPWHVKQKMACYDRLKILYELMALREKEKGQGLDVDAPLKELKLDIDKHKAKILQMEMEIDQSYQAIYEPVFQFHRDVDKLLESYPDTLYWAEGMEVNEKDKLLSKEKAYALLSDCSPVILRFLDEETNLPFTKLQLIAQLSLMQHQLREEKVVDVIRELPQELIALFENEKIVLPGEKVACSLADVFREMQYRFSSHIEKIGKKIIDSHVNVIDGNTHPLFQCLILSERFRMLIERLADLTGMDKQCIKDASIEAAKIPANLTVATLDGERESYQWNIFSATGAFIYHAAAAVVECALSTVTGTVSCAANLVTGTVQCAATAASTTANLMMWAATNTGLATLATLPFYSIARASNALSRRSLSCGEEVRSVTAVASDADEDKRRLLTN